ncbi:diguanylate cyclase [Bradyrhizobium sp. U87765 SZCCT0131]|nr:diguanylate cyclase [Bradyrhizobium sp. U87765 SZCCT0131]MBR1264848.1 diguanylate cyclase [Bradyrhizobium sp. U87765 SZCCT0134]MBR1304830.1 diguanylate cyclase [Bradyrhizobium sp. U87765 SZCCT0110]MBR1320617.1 diguanylate cyclase [Bradyrhizobium sp. U87765 SZCCT0109]MBR1349037.1 diguanylate cyclase [Bradyrhizobium sp. U87765 SZCCT0048]
MQLSVPTIYVVIFANFLALSVVWLHFTRSYPNFVAARFWTASTSIAALGAAFSFTRGLMNPLLAILVGNGMLIFAAGLAWMGVRRFYGQPIPWRSSIVITAMSVCALGALTVFYDDIRMRIAVYSIGQCIPLAMAAAELLSPREGRRSPGAKLAAVMLILLSITHGLRLLVSMSRIDGVIALVDFNGFQAACLLIMVFAGMMANFGFVLMAIDRLRAEVADLALIDDLTGIANRRHFLVRLSESCARASRANEPFALLTLDIDGFKAINDSYGHAAGDECLRLFTRTVQSRLRVDDLFARSGGDEFCVILPATSLSDAALVARNLIKACRKIHVAWNGQTIPLTTSVGIAIWSSDVGRDAQQLIAAADKALYIAKKQGRDRLAVHEELPARLLRETA